MNTVSETVTVSHTSKNTKHKFNKEGNKMEANYPRYEKKTYT